MAVNDPNNLKRRFIDRAELFNRLANLQTTDNEYKAQLYSIIGELPSFAELEEQYESENQSDMSALPAGN